MDRSTEYPGAIPLDTDLLSAQQFTMIALGYALQLAHGTANVVVDGLACTPTAPATMSVLVGPGSIISVQNLEASAWGSLAADTSDSLLKMGINALGTTSFTLTAPGSAGQSQNYLIEGTFQETDAVPVVLPYYNAANPSQPYSGPSNGGASQNTRRIQRVQLQVKAGTPANTGTQTTPAVDAGWVGLYVVTVANGASSVVSGNIAQYGGAPFLAAKLPAIAWGAKLWTDTGTANAMVATLTPPPVSLAALTGISLQVKAANTTTGATPTFNPNGLGATTIINPDGSALTQGQIVANSIVTLQCDGTNFRLMSEMSSIGRILSPPLVISTAGSHPYSPSAGMRNVRLEIQSPGGAGGGAQATDGTHVSVGGAGGAGAFADFWLTAAQVTANLSGGVLPITLGTAGAGSSGAAGGSGTASTVGTAAAVASIPGGIGGPSPAPVSSTTGVPEGVAGGVTTAAPTITVGTAIISQVGAEGPAAAMLAASSPFAPLGGAASQLGCGAAPSVSLGVTGNASLNPGGGGGPTFNGVSGSALTGGGAGGPWMRITEYA